MDPEDFHLRMNYYKKQYETLGDDEGSYIRTHDSGKSLNLHLINGFLRTKIASFVMNLAALNTSDRPIFMTRAGETQVMFVLVLWTKTRNLGDHAYVPGWV